MAKKIHGVALMPGVSRNNRLYTRETIAKAHDRLKARIAEGTHPVVMRTHHDAGDDSLRIVARVTDVSLTKEGALEYDAVAAETSAGKDIATLMEGNDKALAHVSVYGQWLGKPRMVQHEGRFVETADDMEIDKIDFTATPGVLGATARITEFAASENPNLIAESMRPVMFVDESPVAESEQPEFLCVNVSGCVNGFDLSIGAWGVPADQIDAYSDTAQRAIAAAVAVIQAGAVDDDGDAESIDDNAMETTEATDTDQVTETRKESEMTDTTEAVTETATTEEKPLTAADVATAVTEALKAAGVIKVEESTQDADVAETAVEERPVAETVNLNELKESLRRDLVADLVKEGVIRPVRRGRGLTETTEANAENSAEAWENRGEDLAAAFADAFNPQG